MSVDLDRDDCRSSNHSPFEGQGRATQIRESIQLAEKRQQVDGGGFSVQGY